MNATTESVLVTALRRLILNSKHFARKEKEGVITAEKFEYQRDAVADERYINYGKFWEVNYEGLRELFYHTHEEITKDNLNAVRLFEVAALCGDKRPPEDISKGWGYLQWLLWVAYVNAPQSTLDALTEAWEPKVDQNIDMEPMFYLLCALREEVGDIEPLNRTFSLVTRGFTGVEK